MAGLAGHLESDAIGGSVLELESSGREVVEILVEELVERNSMSVLYFRRMYHGIGPSR